MRPAQCAAPHLKIVSWNVAGLRGLLKKDANALKNLVTAEAPDVICLQEHKMASKASAVQCSAVK